MDNDTLARPSNGRPSVETRSEGRSLQQLPRYDLVVPFVRESSDICDAAYALNIPYCVTQGRMIVYLYI